MILASQSPRRKELLSRIVTDFKVIPAHIDETRKNETPQDYVLRLAKEKAQSIQASYPDELILASDTTVSLNETIFGKPKNKQEAFRMLKQLSGKTHIVYTGVCLKQKENIQSFVSFCEVTFFTLSENEINEYLKENEYCDKAGAYAIQGKGAFFIEKINGDYYTVMGLPLAKVKRALALF